MAEKEQAHRHEVESADSKGSLTLASRGQLIAGGLAVIALLGGLLLVIMNNDVQGFSVIVGDAVLFGGAFIFDRFRNRPPKEESSEPSKGDDD
jgi:uncharacterized membrane protein